MWTIRQEQFARMSSVTARNFEARVATHLSCFLPDKWSELGEERDARRFVLRAVSEAAALGCQTERSVARHVFLALLLGIDFINSHNHAWVSDILFEPGVTMDEKQQRIFERLRADHVHR